MADEDFPDALSARYRLHWFVIERVLGQGGFGITYLAHDTNLDRHVAIKEYLPTEVARRRSDASARPRTETHNERYAWGLERFLAEARTLARFDHPNIVRVLSVFEANNTAYMVMRFEEGEDLATLLDRRGTLPEEQVVSLLLPVLDGLQLIHASGFIHRDIKPENIYVRQDGSPVLLDFGSARQSFGSSKTMTILVAPGYAPLEQYYGDAKSQGGWTDIYGLGATCYRAIAGRAPLDAIARAKGVLGSTRDILQPATEVGQGRYGQRLLEAVDHALQLSERNRPQSVAEWRKEIIASALVPNVEVTGSESPALIPGVASASVAPSTSTPATTSLEQERTTAAGSRLAWAAVAGVCAVSATLAYVGWSRKSTVPENVADASLVMGAEASSATQAAVTVAQPVSAPVTVVSPISQPPSGSTAPRATPPETRVVVVASKPMVAIPEVRRDRESRTQLAIQPAIAKATVADPRRDAASALVANVPAAGAPVPPAAQPAVPPVVLASVASPTTPAPVSVTRAREEQQLEAADVALRRGDTATATQILTPLAAAGVAKAQALLGRAQESRPLGQRNDFEAYVWYSIAARNGEAGAAALRDKLASRLQPAEIRQAERIAERWKPSAESTSSPTERTNP